jgi:kinetochore protein NDC80
MQNRRSLRQSMMPSLNKDDFIAPISNNAPPRYSLSGSARVSLGPQRRNDAGLSDINKAAFTKNTKQPEEGLRNSIGNRRSSLNGKISSFQSSSFSGKDPRPIRDKNFQNNAISNLLNHLTQTGYDNPITPRILASLSSKDFQSIFKFLYHQIDQTYEFDKKFEDDVPVLIRGLRYPFANEISKSQLQAVGSMYTWPILLSLLNWLVELIQQSNSFEDKFSVLDNSKQDSFFLCYLFESYKRFLAGIDDNRDILEKLEKSFDEKNDCYVQESDELITRIKKLEEGSKETLEETPLNKVLNEYSVYSSDIGKFKKFIEHLAQRKQKFCEAISMIENELNQIEVEYNESELLKAGFQAQINSQSVCPEDIDKMNTDKEQLLKNLDNLSKLKEDFSRIFWEREVELQKRMDSVLYLLILA